MMRTINLMLLASTILTSAIAAFAQDKGTLSDRDLNATREFAICRSLDPVTAEQLCGPDGLIGPATLGMRPGPEDMRLGRFHVSGFLGKRGEHQGLFMKAWLEPVVSLDGSSKSGGYVYGPTFEPQSALSQGFFDHAAVWLSDTFTSIVGVEERDNGFPVINEECIGLLDMMSDGAHPNKKAPPVTVLEPETASEDITLALKGVQAQFPAIQLDGLATVGLMNEFFSTWVNESALECDYNVSPERFARRGAAADALHCPYIVDKVDRFAAVYRLKSWLGAGHDAFLLYLEDDCRNNQRDNFACLHPDDQIASHIAYVGNNWNTRKLYFNHATRLWGLGRAMREMPSEPVAGTPGFGSSLMFEFNQDIYIAQLKTRMQPVFGPVDTPPKENLWLASRGYPGQKITATSELDIYRMKKGSAVNRHVCRFRFYKHMSINEKSK